MHSTKTIWHCRACGRTAASSRDLTGLGCEGTHEEFVPAARFERLREAARVVLSRDMAGVRDIDALNELEDAAGGFFDQGANGG